MKEFHAIKCYVLHKLTCKECGPTSAYTQVYIHRGMCSIVYCRYKYTYTRVQLRCVRCSSSSKAEHCMADQLSVKGPSIKDVRKDGGRKGSVGCGHLYR